MKIEIVTHCYAGKLPQYAALLHYQLSSLVLHPPKKAEVSYCLYSARTDAIVNKTFDYAIASESPEWIEGVWIPNSELFNRAIGRNWSALDTDADIVWFCDCDYVFGEGCLDALAEQWNGGPLCYPQHVNIHKTHAIGDATIAKQLDRFERDDFSPSEINPGDFEKRKEHKPYGGLFLVRGDWCREHGWLNDKPEFRQPVDGDKPFPSFRDDVAFRKQFDSWTALDLPNLYRLRHSKTTYQGEAGLNGTIAR